MTQTDLEDLTGKNPENTRKADNAAGERLRSIIERVERLEEERKALASDIKDIFSEAKSAGYDVKVIRQLIRIRALDPADVEEQEALLDIYRAALGMLNGTPLSENARRRWSAPDENGPPDPEPEKPASEPPAKAPDAGNNRPEPKPPAPSGPSEGDITAAREQGAVDHRTGTKVTANPWPFGDPRRAAWDEGWCAAAGTDGMDIPDAWRRKPKKDASPKTGGGE